MVNRSERNRRYYKKKLNNQLISKCNEHTANTANVLEHYHKKRQNTDESVAETIIIAKKSKFENKIEKAKVSRIIFIKTVY